ncbi:MAG: DUF6458 family protein [Chloroflexota bacterium]
MTIGVSIFLIAVGAILRYATDLNVEGVSIDTVGLILMIAGGAGLILGFLREMIWSDRRREQRAAEAQRIDQERAAMEQRNPPPPPPRY